MMSNFTLEDLSVLRLGLGKVLEATNLNSTRCVYSSALLKHFLDKAGVENRYFVGEANALNRPAYELITKATGSDMTADEFKQKFTETGSRWVAIRAAVEDSSDPQFTALIAESNQLGGHIANLVNLNDEFYLVDMTAYQFNRPPTLNISGESGQICLPLEQSEYESGRIDRISEEAYIQYEQKPVPRFEALPETGSDKDATRYEAVFAAATRVVEQLNLPVSG